MRHRGAAHVEDPRRRDGEQPLDEIRFGAPQRITVDGGVAVTYDFVLDPEA